MAQMQFKNLVIHKFQHDTVFIHDMESKLTIAFDPYQLDSGILKEIGPVHAIFITHDHFDHFSPKDVGMIAKKDTQYIFPASILDKSKTFLTSDESHLVPIIPLEERVVTVGEQHIRFMAVPAYNTTKISPQGGAYHPKDREYVGFLLEFGQRGIYFAGDTDVIPEMNALRGAVDIAFLPISGTYVMTVDEALEAVDIIQPKAVVPMHYGVVVGDVEMAYDFRDKLQQMLPSVQVELL